MTKQLNEAIVIAGEETAKCKAAKEVIKSLTAQDMAERLPVGASRSSKSTPFTSFGSNPASSDISIASIDQLNGQITCQEPDSNGSNSQLFSNGSSTTSNRSSGYNRISNSEATVRNGSRTKEGESHHDTQWVEQDEPGVYITLTPYLEVSKILSAFTSVGSGLVRNKQNSGGQKTGQECMNNIMPARLTNQPLVSGART